MAITRRLALSLGGAAVATAALPAFAVEVPATVAATPPPVPTWVVGTPDMWDWQAFRAPTYEAACRACAEEYVGHVCDDGEPEDCDCEFCEKFIELDAARVNAWDGRPLDGIKPADWIKAGLGAVCSRCQEEVSGADDEPAHGIGDEAICGECMTLADWEIVNPEHAAQIRECEY